MLKGYIFDNNCKQTLDQYIQMTKERVTYVGRTYNKYARHFTARVQMLTLADPVEPAAPDPTNLAQFKMWKLDIKDHCLKLQEFQTFRTSSYSLVMGQCTEAMQDWLQSRSRPKQHCIALHHIFTHPHIQGTMQNIRCTLCWGTRI